MSNEALSLTKTPEGGMTLTLNHGRTHFAVDVTPAEIAAIRGRIEAWHKDMHARGMGSEIEGTVEGDVREAVLGLASGRMQQLAPPSMMGAAAKTTLAKRAAKKPTTAKKPAVKAALKTPLAKKPMAPVTKAPVTKATVTKAPAPKVLPKPIVKVAPKVAPKTASKVLPKAAPKPAAPKKVDPRKFQIVTRGMATVANRKARLLAWDTRKVAKPTAEELKRGQAFANELFTREGVPTTSVVLPFWDQTPAIITAKVALVVKKGEGLGAPAQLPKPFRLEAAKANLVTQAARTIANRNAAFVAFQRKSTKPNAAELKNAQGFAKDFLNRNQIPATSAPNPFWSQSVAAIKVRLADIIKLAEAQGAPAKPPVPPKPVVVKVDPKKVVVIRKGLVALSARRARFVAFTRKSTKTSAADVQAGKDWARQAFIKAGIPVKLPGRNDFIAGYAVTLRGQAPIVDPTTAFWGQTIATIQVRVNDTLKANEADAPIKLPVTAPEMPTAAAVMAPASAAPTPSPVPAPTEVEAQQAMREVEEAAPEEAAETQQQAIEEVSEPAPEEPYYEEAPAEEAPIEESVEEPIEEPSEEPSEEEPTEEEMIEEPTEEALAENIDSENEAADAAEELTADSETETAGEPVMALRGTILKAARKLAMKRGQRLNKRHVRTAALGIAMMGADSLIAEADAGNPVAQAKIKATVAKANAGSPKAKAATKVLKAAAKRRMVKAKKTAVAPEGESHGIVSLAPTPKGIFKRYFQGVHHAIKGL